MTRDDLIELVETFRDARRKFKKYATSESELWLANVVDDYIHLMRIKKAAKVAGAELQFKTFSNGEIEVCFYFAGERFVSVYENMEEFEEEKYD